MIKQCEYCGETFVCQRISRKYCSDNCKQMAYYKRNGFTPAGEQRSGKLYSPQPPTSQSGDEGFDSVKYVNDVKHTVKLVHFTLGKREYKYVLKCFKGLLQDLLKLATQEESSYTEFLEIVEGLTRLVRSQEFKALPQSFNYHTLIKELQEKMALLVKTYPDESTILFRLSDKRKILLTSVFDELASQLSQEC